MTCAHKNLQPLLQVLVLLALVVVGVARPPAAGALVEDPHLRAVRLVAQMTLDEKLGFIQGCKHAGCAAASNNGSYVGIVPGLPRLGIPDLRMNDGPEGFRGEPGTSTQWPSGLTVAHSWDLEAFSDWGAAMGREFSGKGANVQFGPGANLARIANGGRSFEYSSGEDPFLGFTLIQPLVKSIQNQGVVANAKHYIDNNQEGLRGAGDRHSTSEEVDERTQMEMYFPPFEGAVAAGVLSVMCANNLVNGVYVCENNHTTNHILREYGGFKGWMCSDYRGTRSTIDAANNGLDIAMPGPPSRPDYFGAPLKAAIASNQVSEAVVTEKVIRIVYSLAVVGALDVQNNNSSSADVTSDEHRALARRLAANSAILLQNKRATLPLDLSRLKSKGNGSVALIGEIARENPLFGGGGSGSVAPKSPISVWQAFASKLGQGSNGLQTVCKVTANDTDFFITGGTHIPHSVDSASSCCKACGENNVNWRAFTFNNDPDASTNCWCHPAGEYQPRSKKDYTSGTCDPPQNVGPLVYDNGNDAERAAALASAAEVAIVVIGQTSHEGADRTTLALDQSDLVATVAAAQPNTIVVAISPGPFLTPWREDVPAILDFGFPGEQAGNAIVDVLVGDVNPAGKLPHTMPNKENEMQMTPRQYPGVKPIVPHGAVACNNPVPTDNTSGLNPQGGTGGSDCVPTKAYYDEKLLVGYRWYDQHKVFPAYPFGHGESYTTFKYSSLQTNASAVSFTVTNNGTVEGSEVAQLYLNFPPSAEEPPQQLKGFSKVGPLQPGRSKQVLIPLTSRSFSVWSVRQHAWVVVSGEFGVAVGGSSRDQPLKGRLHIA